MNVNQMFPSSWLKKEDVPAPVTVAIKQVVMDEVAGDHGKEQKPVVHFVGNIKPMILNRGNAECIAALYGDDTTAWAGKSVELYVDPSVMFGGKRVGGLRVRQSQNAFGGPAHIPAAIPATQPPELWDISDGHTRLNRQTSADVERFLATSGMSPRLLKVKPAGAGNDQVKTADQYGFGIVPAVESDPIPF